MSKATTGDVRPRGRHDEAALAAAVVAKLTELAYGE
jgi:hypothetical protein